MRNGFTLVEVVIGAAIFLIVSVGVYQAYRALYVSLNLAHMKVGAADLLSERFEIMRNLPYADVGVVGGNPSGKIPINLTLIRDGISWSATTTVRYVDDPFDGTGALDPKPNDYKLAEVSISCESCKSIGTITVTGRIAPKDLEP